MLERFLLNVVRKFSYQHLKFNSSGMFLSLVDIGKTAFIYPVSLKTKNASEAYLYTLMSYRFGTALSR